LKHESTWRAGEKGSEGRRRSKAKERIAMRGPNESADYSKGACHRRQATDLRGRARDAEGPTESINCVENDAISGARSSGAARIRWWWSISQRASRAETDSSSHSSSRVPISLRRFAA